MNNTGSDHLEALGRSKSKMAAGQPNLENWKIVDHTGQQIGTVYDLLFDKEAKKVRYIITNLNNGELLKQDRLVLMPVGRARYNEPENEVIFPNVTKDQLSALPDYLTVDRLTKEDEYAVRNAFQKKGEPVTSAKDQDRDSFYDHEDFDENSFYNHSGVDRKGSDVNTTQNRDDKKDRNAATESPGKVKAGGGSDTLLTGTGEKSTSGKNNNKKNEDVNVHPKPGERSSDRSENAGQGEKDITNADKKNSRRSNEDTNRD